MITEKARTWLSESGLFKRVLDPGSQIDPTHIVEGNITSLYGNFRDKSSLTAVMEIRIFLLKVETGTEPVPAFGETYKSSVGLESKDAESLVRAFDHCLKEILKDLERDLMEKLS